MRHKMQDLTITPHFTGHTKSSSAHLPIRKNLTINLKFVDTKSGACYNQVEVK